MASALLMRWFNFAGFTIGLVSIVFVGIRLHEYAEELSFSNFSVGSWTVVGLLALFYGASNVLLARAWWYQLRFFRLDVEWLSLLFIYGRSSLGKYVPGNIFHIAGRQFLGMAAGISARQLAKSMGLELFSIAVVGACFAVLTLPLIFLAFPWLVTILIFLGLFLVIYIATRQLFSEYVAIAMLLQAVFLLVSGFVFIGVLSLVNDHERLLYFSPAVCGAYVVAWLIGFITPGAPAGVGVREVILLFLLENLTSMEGILLSVVLGRVVNVIGDLLFFVCVAYRRSI